MSLMRFFFLVLAFLVITASSALAQQGWRERKFPPPNGGLLVYTFVRGDPACASYNGRACLWGQSINQIDFRKVRPLVCGSDHRAKWGVSGYENPRHWCKLAKGQIID